MLYLGSEPELGGSETARICIHSNRRITHSWRRQYVAEKYNNKYKLSTWMYRIALNTAISHYRANRKRKTNTFSINEDLFDLVDENESQELDSNVKLLYNFINGFDELNKALMILYLDNNSYKDIADVLGITETNVATKIGRIKQQLKKQFAKN